MVLCALHNFIRICANGQEDSYYAESDAELKARDRNGHGESGGSDSEVVVVQDMGMVEQRDKMATKMWNDYVQYIADNSGQKVALYRII